MKKGKLRPVIKAATRFTSFDELPLALSVVDVSNVLGLSQSKTYQLVKEEGFPRLGIGRRVIVPKAKFLEWMENNTL